jgi:DNA repair exonuclease SbcCD ATPase subunit
MTITYQSKMASLEAQVAELQKLNDALAREMANRPSPVEVMQQFEALERIAAAMENLLDRLGTA